MSTAQKSKHHSAQTPVWLPEQVRAALVAFQGALLVAFPGQIRRIILYGSYARGEAAPDSDVDVMVVVAWDEERLPNGFYRSMYCDPRWETIVDAAHDVSPEHGIWVSPLVVGENRYVTHQRWSFWLSGNCRGGRTGSPNLFGFASGHPNKLGHPNPDHGKSRRPLIFQGSSRGGHRSMAEFELEEVRAIADAEAFLAKARESVAEAVE